MIALTNETMLDAILAVARILDEQPAQPRYIYVSRKFIRARRKLLGWHPWPKRRGIRGRKAALRRKL